QLFFSNGGFGTFDMIDDRPLDQVSEIKVYGATDDDHFTIVGDLQKKVTIDGRDGTNTITLYDRAVVENTTYDFSYGAINGSVTVRYQSINDITVDASNGAQTSSIRQLLPGMSLTINGSSRSNLFILGDTTLNNIRGNLVLHGGAGFDQIVFN